MKNTQLQLSMTSFNSYTRHCYYSAKFQWAPIISTSEQNIKHIHTCHCLPPPPHQHTHTHTHKQAHKYCNSCEGSYLENNCDFLNVSASFLPRVDVSSVEENPHNQMQTNTESNIYGSYNDNNHTNITVDKRSHIESWKSPQQAKKVVLKEVWFFITDFIV